MPVNRFQPPVVDQDANRTFDDLGRVLDNLNAIPVFKAETAASVSVAAGDTRRLSPRAGGMDVLIPAADGSNFCLRIVLIIETALGVCRVRAASGTINGVTAFTLAAGYTTVIELFSNGAGRWMTARASGYPTAGTGLAYTGDTLALAPAAANTVKGNPTAASAIPTDIAVGTNTVLGRVAGNIVAAPAVNAQLAAMAANTMKVNATAGSASPTDLAIAVQSLPLRAAGNLVSTASAADQVLQRVGSADLGFSRPRTGVVPQLTAPTITAATTVLDTTGRLTLATNELIVGSRYKCYFSVVFVRGATATVFNLNCFFGIGVPFISLALAAPTAAGTYYLRCEASFTVYVAGAGGNCGAEIFAWCTNTAGGTGSGLMAGNANLALAMDTTSALLLVGQCQMNTLVLGTSIQASGGNIERVA